MKMLRRGYGHESGLFVITKRDKKLQWNVVGGVQRPLQKRYIGKSSIITYIKPPYWNIIMYT